MSWTRTRQLPDLLQVWRRPWLAEIWGFVPHPLDQPKTVTGSKIMKGLCRLMQQDSFVLQEQVGCPSMAALKLATANSTHIIVLLNVVLRPDRPAVTNTNYRLEGTKMQNYIHQNM